MKTEGDRHPSQEINFFCDPIIKSITSDLALLGNALMTRINDPLTILEFISVESISPKTLKEKLNELIDLFTGCDSDDDRLKFLLEMQYLLLDQGIKRPKHLEASIKILGDFLNHAKMQVGNDLKKAVSNFQVEALKVVPGINDQEYKELKEDLLNLEKSHDLNDTINAVYEKINMHTQMPFED